MQRRTGRVRSFFCSSFIVHHFRPTVNDIHEVPIPPPTGFLTLPPGVSRLSPFVLRKGVSEDDG